MKRAPLSRVRSLAALVGLFFFTALGWAQAPPAPNPQAPTLKPPVPLGMQRGTSLDLTLTGTNLAGPTGLWTSFPARVTIPSTAGNGKDNGKLLVHLEVPGDAPIGFHALRLATRRGLSNLRLFCMDDLPQVAEGKTNHSPAAAQPVPVPCVVVGKADAELTDYFKVTARAGQRLSFEVLGRRLGSALDPQLALCDSRGQELPGGFSNDAPGLQTDPRLTYTFKEAGDYLVAVRDVSYRGGEDFYYRLRIGDFPCATTPLPLAARRGTRTTVHFAGPAVEGAAPVEVNVPADPTVQALWVTPRGASGLCGWPVSLAVSDLDEQLEKEPNNTPAQANRIPVPGAITARFEQKGDNDYFVFKAGKGKRYIIEAHAYELHSPTEVYMVLRDAKGAQLLASNPMVPPRLEFTSPADGDYTLAVEHLHYWGGPEETYRLTVTPAEPDFDLSVALDRYDVPPGGTLSLPVSTTRRGYPGPIELRVLGPKGLAGRATLPAGQPTQANQPGALPMSAAADLPLGPLVFQVRGQAKINGRVVVRLASVRAAVSRSLADLPLPPPTLFTQIGLAITEKPPFALTARFASPSTAPGKPATLTVSATRLPGFTGPITLTAAGLPPNVAPAPTGTIPANRSEVQLQVKLAPTAPAGQFAITLTGKTHFNDRDFSVNAPPVSLVVKK